MTDRELDSLLARLVEADGALEPPARIERDVLAAYRQARVPAGVRQSRGWLWASLAAAAVIVALVGMMRRPAGVEQPAVEEEAFLPLGTDDGADLEAVHVMRVEMPRTALAGFGYSGTGLPAEMGALVQADLLVGNDGIARGIRFVP